MHNFISDERKTGREITWPIGPPGLWVNFKVAKPFPYPAMTHSQKSRYHREITSDNSDKPKGAGG